MFSDVNSATPSELLPIVSLQQSVTKASLTVKPITTKADTEYAALNDGSQPIPTPPMHAARLSALIKSLANAEDAVAESLKTRKALIAGLEILLQANNEELLAVETQHQEISARKEAMTQRRHEVEDHIMRGLSSQDIATVSTKTDDVAQVSLSDVNTSDEFVRPEIERFTPPPIESTTPPGLPPPQQLPQTDGLNEYERPDYEELTPPPPSIPAYSAPAIPAISPSPSAAVADPRRRPRSSFNGLSNGVGSVKRRKMSEQEDELGDGGNAMAALDADVVGMLG